MDPAAQRAKEIFLELAGNVPAEEWHRRLDEHCASNSELKQRVQALLRAHADPKSYLDQPPIEITLDADAPGEFSERPGTHIGPYKLLQQIGEGGMGVVYMAGQKEPVERRVALKIIKPGMDTRQVIARFEAERQALAMMDHPNIAKVLDAGTTGSGRPFFVMELVRGQPITQYCDEHHLTPRQRLELLLPVCQAIQHAHQKGIIHRDIKPTNILVAEYDEKAAPKVIDFGVAKAVGQSLTEKTMFTGFGQLVGTLEYMSPEQAKVNQLDIDTRSDIYSLGVLLYELLTGSTPFDKQRLRSAAWDEMLRIIREEEPERPSTRLSQSNALAPQVRSDSRSESTTLASIAALRNTEPARLSKLVRGELDWIVMKALEKDRSRRYETASAFAMDLQRYLDDEPVQACPPSAAYRFNKFARQNRVALGTAAMVAATLVAGIIGTTWQAIRAMHEAERATDAEALAEERFAAEKTAREQADAARAAASKQRQIAQEEKQRAEENFDKARRAVDEYLSQVTENELLAVPGLQPLREDLLQAALTFYAEFTQERADDPTIQRELASAHYRLGRIHSELGDAVASRAANNEAIRLYEPLRDRGHFDREMQVALAWAYYYASRFDDAISLCQDVLNAEPENAEAASLLADTYNTLAAASQEKRNDVAAALQYHQQAFELREALASRAPDNPRYLAHLGTTLNNLGLILIDQGKLDQALTMFERGVEYVQQAYEREPHSLLWGRWLYNQLGNVAQLQAGLGREQEALASYHQLVAVSRKRAFENPAVTSLRGDQYQAMLSLARYQQQLGDAGEAARLFREAREVLENIPRETPDQLYELATVYAALAQPVEGAVEPSEEEVADQERNIELTLQTLHSAVDAGFSRAQALRTNRLFDVIRERDDFQQIVTSLEMAAEVQRLASRESESDNQRLADRLRAAELPTGVVAEQPGALRHRKTLAATLHSIGVIQTGLKQFDEAEQSLRKALELWDAIRQLTPESQVDWLGTRIALGRLYWDMGRHPEAQLLWKDLRPQVEQFEASQSAGDAISAGQRLSELMGTIAESYADFGLWEEVGASLAATGAKSDPNLMRWDATIRLLLDDEAGYRSRCAQLVEQSTRTTDTYRLYSIATACLMAPQGYGDLDHWLRTNQAVAEQESDRTWMPLYVGLAYYRAGRLNDALTALESQDHWFMAWPLLAMTCQRLGAHAEAQAWLDRAHDWYLQSIRRAIGNETPLMDGVVPWDRTQFLLLYRESRALIAGTAEPDPWQHLIQARGYRLIGEIEKADAQLAAAEAAAPRAVELGHDEYAYWHALGIAHYRTGNWEEAIAALECSCRLETATNGQGNAWQWLFLAMAHWQLGNQEEARKWYDSAIELETVWPDELRGYRDEAAALLGVTNPPGGGARRETNS